MSIKPLMLIMLVMLAVTSGCARQSTPSSDERRVDVENLLTQTREFLQEENEAKIKNFFSQDYYGGYDAIERRLERSWKNEQILNLQLYINRILEQEGLFNVQVKWNKSYLDEKGITRKATGITEMTLAPHRDSFRILNVTGDQFF